MSTILSPRARAASHRRQRILDAAAAVVIQKGAAALTLDAVSDVANVSKGGLLYYYDSKNTLLAAVADYLAEQLQTEVEQQAAGGSLARAYLQVVARMGELPKDQQVYKALTMICTAQPELAARVRARLHAFQTGTPNGLPLEELHLRLVADGLWIADLFGCYDINLEQRRALLEKLGAA